jgi:carboxymethylenebutenolidase
MSIATRTEIIPTPDGGEMQAYVAVPEAGRGPGLVVLMEIFGVGSYIKRAAERLAELGYVALAPDLYRRTQPGLELEHDQAGMQAAFGAVSQLDLDGAVQDSATALEHLRTMPEVDGPVGVLGFCLGGTLAFGVAAQSDPAVAVSYYGSGVADSLGQSDQITCPVLFHFGAADQFIPAEQIEMVSAAAAGRPDWECHVHAGAGHAFDNHDSEMFHQPEPAARAWEKTSEFLARELPTSAPAA